MINNDTQNTPKAWSDDKLNRQAEGKFISEYLINKFSVATAEHSKNFVLNLNADWGFGKTYFLKNLSIDLKNRQHQIVYFDAWKNDFSDKPMLGFISEINDALSSFLKEDESKATTVRKGVIDKLSKLKNSAAPLMAGFLAKQLVGASFDQIEDLFDDEPEDKPSVRKDSNNVEKDVAKTVSSITTKAAEFALKEHINTKDSIEKFKVNLKDLVDYIQTETEFKLPLFILVDELDRCRPSYAIELLETIKHLFDVEGVYFIVATASHQLSHSVNAVYGNNFESKRYLNRFFDQVYQLSTPDNHQYCLYLWDKEIGNTENFICSIPTNYYQKQGEEFNECIFIIELLASFTKAGLRDISQAIKLLQAIDLTYKKPIHLFPLLFLIFCKLRHPTEYSIICGIWENEMISTDDEKALSGDFEYKIKLYQKMPSIDPYQSFEEESHEILTLLQRFKRLHNTRVNNTMNDSEESSIEYTIASKHWDGGIKGHKFDFSDYPKIVDQVGQLS
jgi:hypothetical protein